jgi:hypothetical protein
MYSTACLAALLSTIGLTTGCGSGSSGGGGTPVMPTPPPITSNANRISADPFLNASSQHATEVEPSIFASGSTLVATFQQGRFFNGGASDIGFATSLDGGATWTPGSLPSTTVYASPAGPFDSVSDPAVAYDAKHAEWLASSLPIFFSATLTPAVLVNRSSDGIHWSAPVSVTPIVNSNDKDWITCDDSPGSPFYGNCYVEWDDPSAGDLIHMNTSSDGGVTWGPILNTADNATGLGGQQLVQPNGTVIVPIGDANLSNILAFVSNNGGTSWGSSTVVSAVTDHLDAANIRSGPLPSAAIDGGGKVYVVWQDCRFRAACSANDIVMSTSSNGTSWTIPTRIPIDSLTSGVDHFIPGIGIDPTTSGAGAHIGITYYYYANTNCSPATCQLFVGFIASQDGGATWGTPVTLAGSMNVAWLAATSQGQMVGDYIATAYSVGHPVGIFAVANAPVAGFFDEGMYAPKPGILALGFTTRRTAAADRAIPGAHSDHPTRPRQTIH